MTKRVLCVAVLVVAMVFSMELRVAEAVTCNPVELSPCLPALTSSANPTYACCSKLREQQPCFCSYLQNPAYRSFVGSDNARRISRTCNVAYPKC